MYCTIPLDVAVAEAEQLVVAASMDRAGLLSAGIDAGILDALPGRADAFAFAAARYQMAISMDPQATRAWKVESPPKVMSGTLHPSIRSTPR